MRAAHSLDTRETREPVEAVGSERRRSRLTPRPLLADTVKALMDDDLVQMDKIGSANYYCAWRFAAGVPLAA